MANKELESSSWHHRSGFSWVFFGTCNLGKPTMTFHYVYFNISWHYRKLLRLKKDIVLISCWGIVFSLCAHSIWRKRKDVPILTLTLVMFKKQRSVLNTTGERKDSFVCFLAYWLVFETGPGPIIHYVAQDRLKHSAILLPPPTKC